MKRLSLLLIVCLSFSWCVADVIYVDADATKGLNNGTSWKHAFLRLEYALSTASSKDQIWVAEATYTPTLTTDRTISFCLVNGVTVYGGFDPGSGIDQFAERDPVSYPCILSGDIGVKGDSSDNSYHVFFHSALSGIDSTAILDGFIIQEGQADDVASPHTCGAGMYNSSSSPKIVNCIFQDNYANDSGGAVYNSNSDTHFVNCRFEDNRGSSSGGAICNISSSPVVDSCIFGESMLENFSYAGGAIYNEYSFGLITDCTFQYNEGFDGGAVYNDHSAPSFSGCLFDRNSVSGASSNWRGGAIANVNSSSPVISNCQFIWNLSPSSNFGKGGAIYCDSTSHPYISSSRFEDNRSHDKGGAIYCDGSSPLIADNCEFIENESDFGGAIYCTNASGLTVTDSLFQENNADEQGGAVHSNDSSPNFERCQFLSNTADQPGGGIFYTDNSAGTISDCEFIGNQSVAFLGGAIYTTLSAPVIENTLFSGNLAKTGAAFAGQLNSYPEFNGCTMINNNAEHDGGALFLHDSSSATITNCVIADNAVTVGYPGYGLGGAAYIEGCTSVLFVNCTIANNTATASVGGLYSGFSDVDMANCIVWGNSGTQMSSGMDVTYCDVQGGYTGANNIDIDPLFVDAAGGDYHIQKDSDCVDTGSNSAVPAGITTDIDGDARIIDGDADMIATVDMGADESPELIFTVWVDDDYTPAGANDGHTWGLDAFSVIQDGIDAVETTGQVYVAPGSYVENLSLDRDVSILGAGACQTIVDGNDLGAVIYIHGVSNAARIDGLMLTNGSGYNSGGMLLGGGLMLLDSDVVLSNCQITGNTADYGGGMDNENGSSPTVINCLFSENTADYGGAIDNFNNASPEIINCTFTQNTSTSGNGSALYNEQSSSPVVTNSILWSNSGTAIHDEAGCATTVTYSNIEGSWPGTGNLNLDPGFIDASSGNVRLQSDSDCIDVGTNLSVLTSVYNTDLDQNERIRSRLCSVAAIVDMGCYEFDRVRIGDFDDNCRIDLLDFAVIAAAWQTDDSVADIMPSYRDGHVGIDDLKLFAEHWLEIFAP